MKLSAAVAMLFAAAALVSCHGTGVVLAAAGGEQEAVSPVDRAVGLLNEIRAQLEKEAKSESTMYDEQVCWCKTEEETKTEAIAAADQTISNLEAKMGSTAGADATLDVNIDNLKAQIAADEAALASATEMREREAAEYNAEEKQMVQDISNLKNAMTVLSKHHEGTSFLQDGSAALASIRAVLRDISRRYEALRILHADSRTQGSKVAAFLSVGQSNKTEAKDGLAASLLSLLGGSAGSGVLPVDIAEKELATSAKEAAQSRPSFLQQLPPATHLGKYSTQSTQIWGILTTMMEEFEKDLASMQQEELQARKEYEELAASKKEQIELGKSHLDELEEGEANNGQALSDSKEDLALTREQRSADVEYLSSLRLTCQDLDAQWAERSKTRAEETKAVQEAIAILREDDNREHLEKSISFLQKRTSQRASSGGASARLRDALSSTAASKLAEQALRSRAAAALRAASQKPGMDLGDLLRAWGNRPGASHVDHRSKLATLAVATELDSFTEVKKMIDQMVADLKEEQQAEVESKAHCEAELKTNEKDTYAKSEDKKDLEGQIEALEAKIATLQEEISAADGEIKATQLGIKEAGQTREKENAEFQQTISDQRQAQVILKRALKRLEAFYRTKEQAAEFIQLRARQEQTPPVQFNDYKTNSGSPMVMSLLEQIIDDSTKLEGDAVSAEGTAQSTYEAFVKSSTVTIAQLQQAIVDKTKAIAEATVEKDEAQNEHGNVVGELEELDAYKADLHSQCDFLLKNFEVRQTARLQEVEALQSAKSILSGSK